MKAIHLGIFLICLIASAKAAGPPMNIPDDFPRFTVPGHQQEMDSLRQLFWHHYESTGPQIVLWDEWLPISTLWPAHGAGADLDSMRRRWAGALASRPIDEEGYVLTQQHDGLAHAEGWPFPLWNQGNGVGWHFAGTGVQGYDSLLVKPDNWIAAGGTGGNVDAHGWNIDLTAPRAVLQTPPFKVEAKLAPWLRLNWWASGLDGANGYVEWTTEDHPDFAADRRAYSSSAASSDVNQTETRTMIPTYRLPNWRGTITGLRFHFDNTGPAKVVIKSFHTAFDSRHNINNSNFIMGCHEYFTWTRDIGFLRSQINRMRTAMRFMQREFDTRRRKCIYTTWPGHEGFSGIELVNGTKQFNVGEGIGSNYWDLLPFGGEDALATIYYYNAVLDLAEIEEQIVKHPEWSVSTGADAFDAIDLRNHAQQVKEYGDKRFWNEKTSRFGTVDLAGNMHDYGFTFLNNEAVYYDFATPAQAQSIHAWIAGQRTVEGDTSQGADIYHWRFGPRSTTRRNLDYYIWSWHSPEDIPWGYQVQDGGAVLGFSYHDLMARLITAGPDDAAARLDKITKWFDEVQSEGGYRAYYEKDETRGSLQGGNKPGGLGLDKEFFESIMVPQVMIYGFLGLHPTADGCRIYPRLPKDWRELTVTGIHLHDHVLDVTAKHDGTITIVDHTGGEPLKIDVPPDVRVQWVEPKSEIRNQKSE